MYRDFTNSAEAMRQERYRVATTSSARNVRRGVQNMIGQTLMKMGERLIDAPVTRTRIEGASV